MCISNSKDLIMEQLSQDLAQDAVRGEGIAHLVMTNEKGEVILDKYVNNMIVAGGLKHICDRTGGFAAPAVMGWMELGTGTAGTAVADTLLATYIASSRTATTLTQVTTTQTSDTMQHVCTFTTGIGTGAITEAGIFNVVTANTATMLNRITFAVINKGASDTLTVTWKVKIA